MLVFTSSSCWGSNEDVLLETKVDSYRSDHRRLKWSTPPKNQQEKTIQILIVESKIRFQILTFPGCTKNVSCWECLTFGFFGISPFKSLPSHQLQQKNSLFGFWGIILSGIQSLKKNVLCRIKPGQLFQQNPWTPTTLKKWQGVTGHLLTWVAIFVVLFHGLLTKNMVPSIWWTKLNRSFATEVFLKVYSETRKSHQLCPRGVQKVTPQIYPNGTPMIQQKSHHNRLSQNT